MRPIPLALALPLTPNPKSAEEFTWKYLRTDSVPLSRVLNSRGAMFLLIKLTRDNVQTTFTN